MHHLHRSSPFLNHPPEQLPNAHEVGYRIRISLVFSDFQSKIEPPLPISYPAGFLLAGVAGILLV
jgi:hypothetical protein